MGAESEDLGWEYMRYVWEVSLLGELLCLRFPLQCSHLGSGPAARPSFWIPRSLSAVQMSERNRCYIERSAVNDDACNSYSKVSRCDSRHDSKGGMLRALSSQTGLAQIAD